MQEKQERLRKHKKELDEKIEEEKEKHIEEL
jgi:hypothetical protein